MNATEAREIINQIESGECDFCKKRAHYGIADLNQAQGYLEALEGPEVKTLVEALEPFANEGSYHKPYKSEGSLCENCEDIFPCEFVKAKEAYVQYKEAIKK